MAYSQVVIPSDGTTTLLVVNFALGYINKSYITVWAEGEVDGAGNPVYRSFNFINTTQMQVSGSAPPVGKNWIISRVVPKSQLIVDWEDGDSITGDNLDTAQLHAIHMTHEALDGVARSVKVAPGGTGPTLNSGTVGSSLVYGLNNTIGPGLKPTDLQSQITDLATRMAQLGTGIINQGYVTPLQYGAVGDGIHDDTTAIKNMIAAGASTVNWLGSEYTWLVKDTLIVTKPKTTWYGDALIKMDRHGLWCKPLVIVMQSATNFWTSDNLGWDHDMETVAGASRVTDLALALGTCFIIMADRSRGGGRFYNGHDNGLAFCSFDYTGDGSPASPYDVTAQHNAYPLNCSFGRVWGTNCGCGEHVTGAGTYKQGGVLDILTAGGVIGEDVQCYDSWAGFIVDFASQASCAVGAVLCKGIKQDPRGPGGSGMGIYNGGMLHIGTYSGDNNKGYDIVCYNTAWVLNIGVANIFASGTGGVWLGGTGRCTGKFHIGHAGFWSGIDKPSFTISAGGSELVVVDVDVTSYGQYHDHGLYNNSGVGNVRGKVRLYDEGASVAPFFSTGYLQIEYNDANGNTTHYTDQGGGKHAFGGAVITASTARAQVYGDGIDMITTSNGVTNFQFNVYWDGTNWRHANTYSGWVMSYDVNTRKLSHFTVPAGVQGAVATLTAVSAQGINGAQGMFNIPSAADDAAAAAAGVGVSELYRNGSDLRIRVS
jgi:hypothetical protein